MTTSRITTIAIRTTALGALLAGFAAVAVAQKVKRAEGPPVTTKGSIESNEHADKGQRNAESRRAEARDDKAERGDDRDDDRGEGRKWQGGRGNSKWLLKGIKVEPARRKSLHGIEKRYADAFKDLEKQERAAEKSGHPDASFAAKLEALRVRERAELRAALTPAEQVQFDRNVAARGARKP